MKLLSFFFAALGVGLVGGSPGNQNETSLVKLGFENFTATLGRATLAFLIHPAQLLSKANAIWDDDANFLPKDAPQKCANVQECIQLLHSDCDVSEVPSIKFENFVQSCGVSSKPLLELKISASAVSSSLNVGTHVKVSINDNREIDIVGGFINTNIYNIKMARSGDFIEITGEALNKEGSPVSVSFRINAYSEKIASCITFLRAGPRKVDKYYGFYFSLGKMQNCN